MVNTRSSGRLPSTARRQLDGEEPGNRDGPGLMRFGSAEDDAAADVGEGAADVDAAAVEVDVADPQGGGLAPAQAGVGQQQDQQTPASGFGGEREDLAVSEVDVIAALRPGQAQAPGRVGPDAAASHGVIERGGHDEDGLPDAGRSQAAERQPGDPVRQALEGDLG